MREDGQMFSPPSCGWTACHETVEVGTVEVRVDEKAEGKVGPTCCSWTCAGARHLKPAALEVGSNLLLRLVSCVHVVRVVSTSVPFCWAGSTKGLAGLNS